MFTWSRSTPTGITSPGSTARCVCRPRWLQGSPQNALGHWRYCEADRGTGSIRFGGQMDGAELMRTVVAAFEKSDLQPRYDAIHEDIVWKTASQQEGLFRFGGEYKDRPGLLAILSILSQNYTFYRFHPKEVIAA